MRWGNVARKPPKQETPILASAKWESNQGEVKHQANEPSLTSLHHLIIHITSPPHHSLSPSSALTHITSPPHHSFSASSHFLLHNDYSNITPPTTRHL
ncbi:hypothetical protein Pcinc_039085 [Petrolisthes cinctipes]|uniref:Uncharacterized protein n=1 Tax=Petrolisthes cinctipes TaxID=88211 RepID=A0AAE1BS08_PETCI|nr:hypothetical protein Pcinc_039085 [Petrolisthes cinctipes]